MKHHSKLQKGQSRLVAPPNPDERNIRERRRSKGPRGGIWARSPGLRAFAAATGSEVFDKLHAGFAGDLAKQAAFFTRRLEAGGKTRADEMTEVEATVAWALDKG